MSSNNALIPLENGEIQGHVQPLCNARDLHAFLDVGKVFAAWIQDRIEQYGFVENQDFIILSEIGKNSEGRGQPKKEYSVTLDMAKEIAMVERNEKGKEARRYFIECERRAMGMAQPQLPGTRIPVPPVTCLYLPEDIHAYVVAEDGELIDCPLPDVPEGRRAVVIGPEWDLADIRNERYRLPMFSMISVPLWIPLDGRQAMFAHSLNYSFGFHESGPWQWQRAVCGESIIIAQNGNGDFWKMLREHGYTTKTYVVKKGDMA